MTHLYFIPFKARVISLAEIVSPWAREQLLLAMEERGCLSNVAFSTEMRCKK